MTYDGMRRANKNYGDSPVRRSSVPIASSLLQAARAYRGSQLRKRLASSARGTAKRLPFGSVVESWPPQPSACPRPSPTLCRALMVQAASGLKRCVLRF
jgi:hypothetical protein